jgi:DNA-binding HxlR family transcriptional regulator
MTVRYGCKDYACTLELAFDLIGGKWKPRVLWYLGEGTLRFRELERKLPDTSRKVLVQQLRQLEAAGLLRRTVHAQVPPRVEYALTDLGQRVIPILKTLDEWGARMAGAGEPVPLRRIP